MLGLSRPIKGGRTVEVENMQICQGAAGSLVPIAEPSGRRNSAPRILNFALSLRANCETPPR